MAGTLELRERVLTVDCQHDVRAGTVTRRSSRAPHGGTTTTMWDRAVEPRLRADALDSARCAIALVLLPRAGRS
jgi:hypothetical protein